MELNQVFLMVSDYKTSYEFYAEKLDLPVKDKSDGHTEFDTGGCALVIEDEFDEETLSSFGLEPPGKSKGDGTIIVIEVEDLTEVYERVVSHGVSPLIEPREVPWGRKMFLVEDPDGYVLEISRPI